MRAFSVTGFSNLSEAQNEVSMLVPRIGARVDQKLKAVCHPSLPEELVFCSYFEQVPTGRVPIHLALRKDRNKLYVRLDVVAPRPDATLEDMVERYLSIWADMIGRLEKYLKRRKVPHQEIQAVLQALSLPSYQ